MAGIESLLVGRVLGGRYRIEEVIGRGGMGAVYRAYDERLGRLVALKVITASGTGDAEARERLRARFFREARSAAALPHHPNVVPVYDYGSDEELGLDYLVMELLRGSDLASRLARSGPPPLAASLKILLEAARGIAVGHRQGLIHRDVKPGNIFLTEPHPREMQVRVVDFGIAKLADDDDTLGQLTQDGRVPHSPAYASPEQLRGLSNLTPASDVFSLGAVGYQLLTGERPFTDSDRNRLSLGMRVEPRSTRELNPAVPGSVDAVIRKALAPEPEERFADAGEMAQALERAMRTLADHPIEPYLAGSAIVTAAEGEEETEEAAALPTAADEDATQLFEQEDDRTLLAPPPPVETPRPAAPPEAPPPRPPVRSAAPPRKARQPSRRSGIGGLLVWVLVFAVLGFAGLMAWDAIQGDSDFAVEIPPPPDELPDPDSIPVVPDVPTPLDAVQSNTQGILFFNAARFDSALVYFQRAVDAEPRVPQYRRNLGLALLRLGDPTAAEGEFQRAIELAPDLAPAYESLARAQLALGDTVAAMQSLEEYLARETNPELRAAVERDLRNLETLQNPDVDLLGETVEPTRPTPTPGPTEPTPAEPQTQPQSGQSSPQSQAPPASELPAVGASGQIQPPSTPLPPPAQQPVQSSPTATIPATPLDSVGVNTQPGA